MAGRSLRLAVAAACAGLVLPWLVTASPAGASQAGASPAGGGGGCSAGAHTLASPGSLLYPETGNGGYTSLHTLVHLVYNATTNKFLPGNRVVLTEQNDPNPAAHEASESNPVGGPNHNPLPPACTPELPNTNAAADSMNGTQCPANKLVITPSAPIRRGVAFTVTVNYTGRPGVHNDGDGTTEGWFRASGSTRRRTYRSARRSARRTWLPWPSSSTRRASPRTRPAARPRPRAGPPSRPAW